MTGDWQSQNLPFIGVATAHAALAALVGGALVLLLSCSPRISLLALALPPHISRHTAIPSVINPLFWSPTLLLQWLRLALLTRTPPWRLHRLVRPAATVDWFHEGPDEGDCIVAWQRLLLWRERDGCLPLKALKLWEQMGDPMADAFLSADGSQLNIPADAIGNLHRATATPDSTPTHRSALVMGARPPRGAGVLPLQWYASRDAKKSREIPHWLQEESNRSFTDLIPYDELSDPALALRRQLDRYDAAVDTSLSESEVDEELAEEKRLLQLGQDVFYKYSGGILLALLHFSLASGFASPRLSGILRATNYLIPSKRTAADTNASAERAAEKLKKDGDKTWRRLIETTQWVLDVMESVSALDVYHSTDDPLAFKDTSGRLKKFGGVGRHASLQVRFLHARVRHRVRSLPMEPGLVPLNQADLLVTLLSFSAAPLASLARMGLSLSQDEQEAYLGVWRHVGWLTGVDDRLIRRCLSSTAHADRALWSSVRSLFNEEQIKLERPPTYSILQSIADRPPFHTSFALHCALTTSLVGEPLSDALGLPRPSRLVRLKVWTTYVGMWFTTIFDAFYPRRQWQVQRLRVSRSILRCLIQWNLGMKHSLFQGHATGDAGFENVTREDGQTLQDVKVYHYLMREMVLVYVALGLAACGATFCLLCASPLLV